MQFKPNLFILMDTVWVFVVTVMTEPYLESVILGLVSDRLTSSPYVMPFKPMARTADKALGVIFLDDAFH